MELLNEHFNVDLNGHDFLKKYGEKILHIACCNKEEERSKFFFSDWKGHFKPQLKKIFDVLTGPERIQDQSHIKFIVLCCSNGKIKEFLSFLTEISMKYEVLKHFSFISQNDSHLKASIDSIIEEYGEDSVKRNLPTLLKENSICLPWNVIDSFVKQNCLEPVEGKYVQSSSGVPIRIKPKIIEKFYSNSLSLLASNECQEIATKHSKEISAMHDLTMKNFLRGKDPSWELYYFVSEKTRLALGKVVPDALIEREMLGPILNKVELSKQSSKVCLELIGIGHLPGTGASTVAMHVLWLLKEKYRCLKVICKEVETYNLDDLASYVLDFRSFGEEKKLVQGKEKKECLPLLILMDNTNHEVAVTFQKKIQNEVLKRNIKFNKTLGIILFVHNNKLEQSSSNFNLSEKFTPHEKDQFKAKVEQFKENVDSDQLQMEDMIGFLIMVNKLVDDTGKEYKNYIAEIVSKIAYAMEAYPNERWLLLILAIFKYYNEGNITLSHALIILKYGDYQEDLMQMVCDHFKMLVNIRRDHEEGFGDYKVIEITHCEVAEVLMESFLKSEDKLVIDVLNDLLENKSLLNYKFLRNKFIEDLRVMVVRRKWNECGRKRQTFSPLILDLKNKNSTSAIQFLKNVIEKLDSLKLKPKETGVAMIHQTLSRLHLAIHQLEDAKECIYRAIKINNKNFTFYDTAGQIFKKEINDYCKSDDTNIDMNQIFILSSEAIKYFKKAQILYEDQNFNYGEKSFLEEDYNDVELFKTAIFPGYFGEINVNLCMAEKLMGLAKENEKDDVRSFISGKKGVLIRNIARQHNIDLVTHTELLSKINERILFCMQAIAKKLDFNTIQDNTKILRSLSKRYSEIFSDSCFEKLSDKLKSTKTKFVSKLKQVKCYFEIFLVESLYCVQSMTKKELLNLHDTVKALKNAIDTEQCDILSLDTFLLVCLLNGNIAKSLEDPIFNFKHACLLSKHLALVCLEKYEIYFWYTVLNWPTAKESELGSLNSAYDESILENCLKCLLQIYRSTVTCARGEKIHSTHKPFYMLQNETGYKKIAMASNRPLNNERLKGKLLDEHSVEYILPFGTKLSIRCAHLRLNRGSWAQEITFELGFTLAGPVAYNCEQAETLKDYNDLKE